MKVIIAGSRDLEIKPALIKGVVLQFLGSIAYVDKVIEGGAQGVDAAAKDWADLNEIPVETYEADWDEHGKVAGPIRNQEMAKRGDMLLLIWDGQSKGSANMKKVMQEMNKPVYEVILK